MLVRSGNIATMIIERCEYCRGSGVLPLAGTTKAKRCICCCGTGKVEQLDEDEEEENNNE